MSNVAVLICARGGSKGLPGKNMRKFADKPLIAHSIELGKKLEYADELIVSTDDLEIAETAKEYGANVPFIRPPELATDKAPEWAVWRHALEYFSSTSRLVETLVVLPPTAPLRTRKNVDDAYDLFRETDCDGVICGTKSHRNPLFNMVSISDDGFCSLAISRKTKYHRRQDAPHFYDLTTVCYVISSKFVLSNAHLFDGRILINEVDQRNAIDIDTLHDFELAEYFFSKGQNS